MAKNLIGQNVVYQESSLSSKVSIKNAIFSVYDKSRLENFLKDLFDVVPDLEIISSGGTARKIRSLGYKVLEVSKYTGFPEMPGGLVKTLHPRIHAGILGELTNQDQQVYIKKHDIRPINLVVCNLYPFTEVIKRQDFSIEDARSNIDIGGPTLVRAAAKNFPRVTVIVDPSDYSKLIQELKANDGKTTLRFRLEMARKAFNHVLEYDKAISNYLDVLNDADVESFYLGV